MKRAVISLRCDQPSCYAWLWPEWSDSTLSSSARTSPIQKEYLLYLPRRNSRVRAVPELSVDGIKWPRISLIPPPPKTESSENETKILSIFPLQSKLKLREETFLMWSMKQNSYRGLCSNKQLNKRISENIRAKLKAFYFLSCSSWLFWFIFKYHL